MNFFNAVGIASVEAQLVGIAESYKEGVLTVTKVMELAPREREVFQNFLDSAHDFIEAGGEFGDYEMTAVISLAAGATFASSVNVVELADLAAAAGLLENNQVFNRLASMV